MNVSSIAIRACTYTVKPSIAAAAATSPGRSRPVKRCASANAPAIVALPASVDMTRQPNAVSPNSAMPIAISSFASGGCSTLAGPLSASIARAAGT